MKRLVCISIVTLLSACGYVLHENPIQYANAPKLRRDDYFYVFVDELPTNKFRVVCSIYAASDVGSLPNVDQGTEIAQKYASKHGGNGVILQTISDQQRRINERNAKAIARLNESLGYNPDILPANQPPVYSEIKVIYIEPQ